ncbi:PREDICTED: uncharacterized protein LOC108556832 [Nicrophorus vespilloides]|uniref:Uncharacterized protein LOC108556832 n=1 Tax=Nicrophorus vespilloides TaxID=110193 RepID=A0ABM1M1Z9_NICVS|nr:PREDICTED: uncharacterized protein LOC108556832 [Nicrophorus vespilloides]
MFKSLFIAAILVAFVVQADARRSFFPAEYRRSSQNGVVARNVLPKVLSEVDKLVLQVIDDDLKIPFLNEVLTIVHKTIRKVRSFHESLPSFIKNIIDRGVDYSANLVLRVVSCILKMARGIINRFKGIFSF